MNFRWHLFWIKDFFQKNKIKKVYDDIEKNHHKIDLNEQKSKLDKLLKEVINNCEYYANYNVNINEFPVVNKMILKENTDKLLNKKYQLEKLHKMSTSGSTGTPFTVYQNKEKRNRVIAEVLYYGKIINYTFGEKQFYFRIWVNSIKKNTLKRYLQNMNTIDISNLSDTKLDEILKNIDSKKVKCILSYASTLERLVDYAEKIGYEYTKGKLKCIISSSELLSEKTRKKLMNIFKCKVYSRYSNEENGILGQDTCTSKTFDLNYADYYFEFLNLENDEPAKEGELSRVVVTDLYNYAMPMIRYDTGDLAIYKTKNKKKYITELYGRKVDLIYNTKNEEVSPHTITNNMWEFEEIKQFKFIQCDTKKYKIVLNTDKKIDESIIIKKFKAILGQDAKIDIEYTNEIPVLNSGKRKYIENIMTQKGRK